jgi:uncharacterized iron-regulated membrane protein
MPNPRLWNRKLHRWGAIAVAVPFLIVITTGLVLQVKKQVPWVQPVEQKGTPGAPAVSMDALLAAARSVPEAGVDDWADIDRIDVRPSKGLIKIIANSRWEVQVDGASGAVLQTAYRRSDLMEQLHDGSWFHDAAKLWIFLPSGVIVLLLWVTGIYLFLLPIRARRAKSRGDALNTGARSSLASPSSR